ncbi:MAG: Vitamin K epoxide reductase [Chloroflexota bacterium]|nr:Vitamin K epoxide reductase [Chloroflexota bacterium]
MELAASAGDSGKAMARPENASGIPIWRFVALALLALAGFGISAYLTAVHYADAPLACSVTSLIDCSAVTHSAYSVVSSSSVPIAALGLVWFGVVGGAAITAILSTTRQDLMVMVQAALALGGLLYVLYLVYVELVQLHRICEWCTGVHLLTVGIFFMAASNLQALLGGHGETG